MCRAVTNTDLGNTNMNKPNMNMKSRKMLHKNCFFLFLKQKKKLKKKDNVIYFETCEDNGNVY